MKKVFFAALAIGAMGLSGCRAGQKVYETSAPGDPHEGKQLMVSRGCAGCHIIPGIREARGLVGPPLLFYGRRTIIAGEFPNTPPNLTRWLLDPPALEPGTAMPNTGLNQKQAQDIAAYLERLH